MLLIINSNNAHPKKYEEAKAKYEKKNIENRLNINTVCCALKNFKKIYMHEQKN